MKLHTITLSCINTGEKVEYILNISEEEVFDIMEMLSNLHEIVHGGHWNAIASLTV